jgi:hypothetical protein
LPEGVLFLGSIFYLSNMFFIAAIIGAIVFLPSLALNIALACGAPLGMYAMNGRHKIVPKEIRRAFVMPIILQFVALFTILSAGHVLPETIPFGIIRILAFFFAVYLTFYTATVLFSLSAKERQVMGFFAIASTICFWIVAVGTI